MPNRREDTGGRVVKTSARHDRVTPEQAAAAVRAAEHQTFRALLVRVEAFGEQLPPLLHDDILRALGDVRENADSGIEEQA